MVKITPAEWFFLALITFGGIALSSKKVILYLDTLTPIKGLLFYYALFYLSLFVLSKIGLSISRFNIKKPLQIIGTLLITFSFFIVINFESPYINEVTGRGDVAISPILYQSEDGATWYLWSKVTQDLEVLRWLTFVITPLVLSLVGVLLVSKKIDI